MHADIADQMRVQRPRLAEVEAEVLVFVAQAQGHHVLVLVMDAVIAADELHQAHHALAEAGFELDLK
jgi:hypothetical protein